MQKIFISGDSHVAAMARGTRKEYFDNSPPQAEFDVIQKMSLHSETGFPKHSAFTTFKEKDFEIAMLNSYYKGYGKDYSESIDFSLIANLEEIKSSYKMFFWYGYNDIIRIKDNSEEIVNNYLTILTSNFDVKSINMIYPLMTVHIHQSFSQNYRDFCAALRKRCLELGTAEPISITSGLNETLLNINEYRDQSHLKDHYYYGMLSTIKKNSCHDHMWVRIAQDFKCEVCGIFWRDYYA